MATGASDAYTRYGRALLRKAERILQSRADAQDIVHALFADLLQKTERNERSEWSGAPSRSEGSGSSAERNDLEPVILDLPYLYRAVTNRCLTYVRDAQNRARLLEGHDEALRGAIRTRCDDRAIDMDLLLKLTHTLDEPTLEVVVCRFFDDMTQEEIAELLGISRKAVSRKLDDAREAVVRLSAEPARGRS